MAFREKLAWSAFATTVIAWGGYFVAVVALPLDGPSLFWLFVAATVTQAVLLAAAATFAALSAPGDAHTAKDERDRAVDGQATTIAYMIVLAALIGVIIWLHFGLHGANAVLALIGVFILGEAARYGAQAIGYRRAS